MSVHSSVQAVYCALHTVCTLMYILYNEKIKLSQSSGFPFSWKIRAYNLLRVEAMVSLGRSVSLAISEGEKWILMSMQTCS